MTDELLKALQLIKEECAKHESGCDGCPMATFVGTCGITNEAPTDWSLNKKEVYF